MRSFASKSALLAQVARTARRSSNRVQRAEVAPRVQRRRPSASSSAYARSSVRERIEETVDSSSHSLPDVEQDRRTQTPAPGRAGAATRSRRPLRALRATTQLSSSKPGTEPPPTESPLRLGEGTSRPASAGAQPGSSSRLTESARPLARGRRQGQLSCAAPESPARPALRDRRSPRVQSRAARVSLSSRRARARGLLRSRSTRSARPSDDPGLRPSRAACRPRSTRGRPPFASRLGHVGAVGRAARAARRGCRCPRSSTTGRPRARGRAAASSSIPASATKPRSSKLLRCTFRSSASLGRRSPRS